MYEVVCAPTIQALFFNHLYDPISLVRDNEVKAAMVAMNVLCQSFNGDVLYEPWEVLAEGGRPFTNFASFWARCSEHLSCCPRICSSSSPTNIGVEHRSHVRFKSAS